MSPLAHLSCPAHAHVCTCTHAHTHARTHCCVLPRAPCPLPATPGSASHLPPVPCGSADPPGEAAPRHWGCTARCPHTGHMACHRHGRGRNLWQMSQWFRNPGIPPDVSPSAVHTSSTWPHLETAQCWLRAWVWSVHSTTHEDGPHGPGDRSVALDMDPSTPHSLLQGVSPQTLNPSSSAVPLGPKDAV